jgi:type I restriction enzyme, S subunit
MMKLADNSSYPSVRKSVVADMLIPLPPLPEQRRIADVLDAAMAEADAATRSAEVQHTTLNRLEFRILEAAFPVLPLALEDGDAPDGWTWRLLTDAARLESGHTPSRRRPEWWGGDTPWIALPDIRALDGATAFQTGETINDGGLANSSARLLPAGTVCLSRTASVGFVTVMGRPMATSQDFVNWVCGRSLNPWFLAYALMASRSWLREIASGAVHKTIYMPTLKALRICTPGLEEQSRIVAHIERCRAEIGAARDAATAQKTALETLPSAILTAAFEGRL